MSGVRWLLPLAFALAAAAILSFRPVATPGPFLRDFEAYWSAGSAWNAGGNPYGRAIWNAERTVPGVDASRDEILPFVAPPPTIALWSLLARLPYPVAAGLWSALLAVAALALVIVVVRASAAPSAYAFLCAGVLAVGFGPLTSDLALGQVALLAFLAATLASLPLPLLGRIAASFVAFAQPNVAFGLVALLGRNRATIAIGAGALAAFAFGALFFGVRWPIDYAMQLAAHAHAERFGAIQFTPAAIAYGAGFSLAAAAAIAVACAAAAALAAIALWRRIGDPFARFAAIAALAPFVTTFFHEHDLVVAYAAAGWCAFRTRGPVRSLALAATLLAAIDWLGLAQRPTGIAQSALLAAAAACAFVALGDASSAFRRRELFGALAATTVVAFVFAIAAWLGAAHPAPVWPDALGAFHAPSTAPIAGVWAAEQQRTGLLAVDPVWAFLRALSLLGCALLSYCVYDVSKRHVVA